MPRKSKILDIMQNLEEVIITSPYPVLGTTVCYEIGLVKKNFTVREKKKRISKSKYKGLGRPKNSDYEFYFVEYRKPVLNLLIPMDKILADKKILLKLKNKIKGINKLLWGGK